MDATEEQLEFPVIYAAARDDLTRYDANDGNMDFKPLYDTILKEVPNHKVLMKMVYNFKYLLLTMIILLENRNC